MNPNEKAINKIGAAKSALRLNSFSKNKNNAKKASPLTTLNPTGISFFISTTLS